MIVRFKHNVSLVTGVDRFDLYCSDGTHDWFHLRGCTSDTPAVQLDEGLVHIQDSDGVVQVESHEGMGFSVQVIRP